jgi:hypothetical protein
MEAMHHKWKSSTRNGWIWRTDETFDAKMKLLKNMKIYEKQMEEYRKMNEN